MDHTAVRQDVAGDGSRRAGLSKRTLVLGGLLAAAVAAFFLTGRLRADLAERMWLDQLAVRRADQLQEQQLHQRQLRTDLRAQLRALAQEPEDFEVLLKAASLHGQLQQYPEALFVLSEAQRLKPREVEVFRARAQVYLSTGAYDRCLEVVEAGLKIKPDDMELSLLRLDVDTALGAARQAQPRMARLLKAYPQEPRVHLMAALLGRQVADAKTALAHLKEAERLDPRNDKIYGVRSVLEWELGRREDALRTIHKAIDLNPRDAAYLLHLGDMERLESGGAPAGLRRAEEIYRRALELDPANDQIKFGIAMCRVKLGDPLGEQMLKELVRLNPTLPSPQLELGNLYMKQGRREEGAALLARYQQGMRENDELKGLSLRTSMRPDDVDAFVEMAEYHVRTGFPQKAIVPLRRALRMRKTDQEIRKLLVQALVAADRAPEVRGILAKP